MMNQTRRRNVGYVFLVGAAEREKKKSAAFVNSYAREDPASAVFLENLSRCPSKFPFAPLDFKPLRLKESGNGNTREP